jgi:hypothetical protein
MTLGNNVWSDVSSIAQRVESDAIFTVRETNFIEPTILGFRDMSGMNLRRGYKYNSVTVNSIGDEDDLTSQAFTPSADQTLTPYEEGAQFFISDARAESELPESILNDAAQELGLGAADKVMTTICAEFPNLTGGSVGTTGATITWGYIAAGIAQARNANKSNAKPLACVIHVYQAALLASTAAVAGASNVNYAPNVQGEVFRSGLSPRFMFMGVPIYQVFQAANSSTDFVGGIYPREAIAIDWRRPIRIRPERDESRRGLELNMSYIYDVGIWRPTLGIQTIFHMTAPTN